MFRNWFKREPIDDITAVAHLVRAVMRDEPQWKEIRITRTASGVEYVLNRATQEPPNPDEYPYRSHPPSARTTG